MAAKGADARIMKSQKRKGQAKPLDRSPYDDKSLDSRGQREANGSDSPGPHVTSQKKKKGANGPSSTLALTSAQQEAGGTDPKPSTDAGCLAETAQTTEQMLAVVQDNATLRADMTQLKGQLEQLTTLLANQEQQQQRDVDERQPKRPRASTESIGGLASDEERQHQAALRRAF